MAWTLRIQDTFTESGSGITPLTSHTPNLGGAYSTVEGTTMDVDDFFDQLRTPAASAYGSNFNAESLGNDVYSELTLVADAGNTNFGIWLRGSGSGGTLCGYLFQSQNGTNFPDGNINIYRCDNGSFTQIGTYGFKATAGQVFKAEAIGSALKGYIDSVEVVSATDATYASGVAGLRGGGTTGRFASLFEVYEDSAGGTTWPGYISPFGWRPIVSA